MRDNPRLTRALALLTVLLVTAAGVACAGSDEAQEDRIAFAIERDGDWRLVTANADGSGDLTVLRHLSESPGDDTKWSPDGKKIASTDFDGLWVINADGTGFREVVAGYSLEGGFAWSPDGGQLAFLERPGLYVEDADGANRRLIVRCDFNFDSQVAWSPDGGTIVYSDRVLGAQIHLVHPDGTGRRVLTRGYSGLSPELSWSPDGKRIAFTRPPVPYVMGSDGVERENPEEPVMYVINADGSSERELGSGEGLAWSPDGTSIAFIRGRSVHAIKSDGSGERRLGRGDHHLSWSPSGTRIAVRRDLGRPLPAGKFGRPSRKSAIWIWNVDGSGGRQVWPREGLCRCGSPAWRPD